MLTACFSVMIQLLLLLIRIAMKLRLSIPLVYLALMLTAFRPWYRVHATLADGIFLVMLGCVMLSWIISLVFLRRTVGRCGVCVAQTCTDTRSAHKTAHIGTTRPTPRSKRLRRRAFPTCAIVQPLVLRLQAALGSGFSLQAAFRYQNAMLALFLCSKKSQKCSPILIPLRRFF